MIDQPALTRVLSDFARLLVRDYAVTDALHDLVDGVTEVMAIAGAGVSLAEAGTDRITFATAVDEPVATLERVQEQTQAGPCVEAHRSGRPVLVADLAEDPRRWPVLSATAARAGMVAVAGIPMHLNGTRLGALNIYDRIRHDWSDEEVAIATLLADMATACVANATRLDGVRHTAEQLQEALESRIVIEQAKGMLAKERNISVDEAFRMLRSHARNHNASLRSVAEAVVTLRLRL